MNGTTLAAAGRHIEALVIPGDPSLPQVVLLHEGLGSAQLWRDVPERLASATGCTVLAFSRYGNGFSDALTEPRPIRYMHDEAAIALPAVLEQLGASCPILLGHSDGASIALLYAAGYPDRVRGVIAEAPHVFVEDISVRSIAAIRESYERTDLRERIKRHHRDAERTFYGWNDVWLHPEFRAWDIRDEVRRIRAPLLLVQGENDEYGTRAQLDAIRRRAAGMVDTLYLGACGHAPHRDRPELTLGAMAAFIRACAAP